MSESPEKKPEIEATAFQIPAIYFSLLDYLLQIAIYCFFSRDSDIEYIMVNFGFPTCLMDFLRVSITVMSQISRFPIECNNLRHSRITLSLPCTAQYPVRRYLDRFRASCKFLSVRSFTVH
jgi:hypothetical protein